MEEWPPRPEPERNLDYYEAIPYLLVVESVERGGRWLRRAEHPELPGCAVEAHSALEAIDRLEGERRRLLKRLWDSGATIPAPRAPLRSPWAFPGGASRPEGGLAGPGGTSSRSDVSAPPARNLER